MVDSKRYDPTITRFQKHTKSFVSGKTKKGHLNDDDRSGDTLKEEGILVKVDKNNLSGNGWYVKVGNKELQCTYGDNIIYLPPCNLVGTFYYPKNECKVEVSIDTKSKINTVTRINDENKSPISMTNESVQIEAGGNSSIKVSGHETIISGNILKIDTGDIKVTGSGQDYSVTDTINDLYEKIETIQTQLSDNNDI